MKCSAVLCSTYCTTRYWLSEHRKPKKKKKMLSAFRIHLSNGVYYIVKRSQKHSPTTTSL